MVVRRSAYYWYDRFANALADRVVGQFESRATDAGFGLCDDGLCLPEQARVSRSQPRWRPVFPIMSGPSKKSSDSSDEPVPWILPRSRRGVPTGYRAFVVLGGIVGIMALPYGLWTYLLGLATVGAMMHQAIIDKRAAQKRDEWRKLWRDSN